MKLKNIFALTVACGAALIMSVAAHAATEVKVSGASMDEYGAVLPVVINTTDGELMDEVSAYEITVNYDPNVWSYDSAVDDATYTSRGQKYPMGSMVTNPANNNDGTVEIVYSCGGGNGFAAPDANGQIALCTVYLTPKDSSTTTLKDSDFSVGVKYVADYDGSNNTSYMGTDMRSFFTFDVTGDLGGNEIVALGASTDGGVTIQPLEYYVSTDWNEGMAYADATTKFLVAVNNTKGTTDVADVTIYGELADGSYIPLASHSKNDFLVQSFYRG